MNQPAYLVQKGSQCPRCLSPMAVAVTTQLSQGGRPALGAPGVCAGCMALVIFGVNDQLTEMTDDDYRRRSGTGRAQLNQACFLAFSKYIAMVGAAPPVDAFCLTLLLPRNLGLLQLPAAFAQFRELRHAALLPREPSVALVEYMAAHDIVLSENPDDLDRGFHMARSRAHFLPQDERAFSAEKYPKHPNLHNR